MTLRKGELMEAHSNEGLMLYPQQGSALVISLLTLLVMTLLGVTAMTTSRLQEKMAINARQYNLAFQASESALRTGEEETRTSALQDPTAYTGTCGSGLCLPSTSGTPAWLSTSWATGTKVRKSTTDLAGISSAFQPMYIIEILPQQSTQGTNISQINIYGNKDIPQYYRITSYGSGADGTGAVMLQSVFRP
jgi:type IV pilus assembly protein PilX